MENVLCNKQMHVGGSVMIWYDIPPRVPGTLVNIDYIMDTKNDH